MFTFSRISRYRRAQLTHWGRVTHICVGKLSIIGSDNGLSPNRRQAIILTNAGILLIGTLGTNFSEVSIAIYTFSFSKMQLKMSSGKWWPCCLGLNELIEIHPQGRQARSILYTECDSLLAQKDIILIHLYRNNRVSTTEGLTIDCTLFRHFSLSISLN